MPAPEKAVHIQELLSELLSPPFLQMFKDVVLVFNDGDEVNYNKGLLCLLR